MYLFPFVEQYLSLCAGYYYHGVGRLCMQGYDVHAIATCQYKKISQNLRNGTLYNHIPLTFECFHDQQDSSHREKPSRKYLTRYSQNGQIVFLSFFFLSSSSDNLALHCLNLSRWFSHETAAFSTEQCNVPSLFRYLQVFTRRLQLPTQ